MKLDVFFFVFNGGFVRLQCDRICRITLMSNFCYKKHQEATDFNFKIEYIPVISSRAGGRKFQKEKETIGRSDALLIFAPDTHVLQWSAISLNARIPPIKLESLLLITFL